MIHHISIPANNPSHVANVLAEIFKGKVGIFPPNQNSYMVMAGDEYGTLIEIYPTGSEIVPGIDDQQASFQQSSHSATYAATHAAISVPTSREEIEQIAALQGWRVLPCNRDGLFDVIEFWIENRLMLELLTPEIAGQYLNVMHPSNVEKFL
ncbi:MAG: hypothetical protein ACRC11_17695, partial [Xenococcaceae cyanobacterium]